MKIAMAISRSNILFGYNLFLHQIQPDKILFCIFINKAIFQHRLISINDYFKFPTNIVFISEFFIFQIHVSFKSL